MGTSFVNRRIFGLRAGSALAAGAVGWRGLSSPAQAQVGEHRKAPLRIAIGGKGSLYYLPLTVAERLGYFAAEGLDVQVREMPEPGHALQALLTGSVQALSCPYGSVVS